jgi:tetratricopeptide (TPR) repeat protein
MNTVIPQNNPSASRRALRALSGSVVNKKAPAGARLCVLCGSVVNTSAARRTPFPPLPLVNKIFAAFYLVCVSLLPLSAQTGWDHIRQNDFVSAKSAFEQTLQSQPGDEATLSGLLFLSETLRDEDAYRRYANQLLTNGWQPQYVWLFDHLYSGRPEKALQQQLPYSLTIPFLKTLADSLFQLRRFEESKNLNSQFAPEWNWAVTGPFTNVGGSGFVEKTPVEGRPFSWQDTFRNENGQAFFWIRQPDTAPGEQVLFDALPSGQELGVYYANTFLQIPETREVDLFVTRQQPIKIWLDDHLILSLDRPGAPELYDSERLRFTLPAGAHRLLVKIAEFPPESSADRLNFQETREEIEAPEVAGMEDFYGGWVEHHSGFLLRFADPATGKTLEQVQSISETPYPSVATLKTDFADRPYLEYFMKQVEQHPDDWGRLYLLSRAYGKYAQFETGEAYFAAWQKAHPDAAFGKYLLAKLYDANDKTDRAEALLSEMDTIATPTFAEHLFRLDKIDSENSEAEYLAAMEKILQLSPTNKIMLDRYLSYLQEKGRKDQLRDYVRKFLDQYRTPFWEKHMNAYLKDDSYKPEGTTTLTDRERERNFQQALKNTRKRFYAADYEVMLHFYRLKERESDVLKTYDELIRIVPGGASEYEYRKARYLFERDRFDEALNLLTTLIRKRPFNAQYCETIGDIHVEKKNDAQALYWYHRASELGGGVLYQLDEKIDKLAPKELQTRFFETVDVLAIARDTMGISAYASEESYIQLFSQQLVFDAETQTMEAVRKVVVRINSETGARYWTEADLQLLGEINSARVLKKDGTVSSPNVGWGMAVFKNLQAGDVIIVEGGGRHDMPMDIPQELLFLAPLSWPVPVARATLELVLPDTQQIYFAGNRIEAQPASRRDTAGVKILHWEWQNLAKLEDEDAAPDNYDAMAWLMMGSVADWSKVVQWYERLTYARTEVNYELREQAQALIRPDMQPEQIVTALHQFITRDINYSYVPFMNSNYVPKKAGATLAGKIGDCKDVATLMIALLREYGIPAWYTLVSTHQFSSVEARPALYIFNHAIVAYQLPDGALRFADLTTDYFPTGILPAGDCGAWALVIRPGETQLRRLPDQLHDTTLTRIDIRARARLSDGDLDMEVQADIRGVVAGNWREVLLGASPEDRLKELSGYFGGNALSHTELEDIRFTNMDDVEVPLQLSMRMKAYQVFDQVLDFQIMPLPLPMSLSPEKALFAARRYNDLDLDALFEIAPVFETIDLELPPGRKLAEMPRDRTVESPFGRYELRFSPLPNGLRVERRLVFHRRFVKHSEFEEMKRFYREVLNGDGGMVVLK